MIKLTLQDFPPLFETIFRYVFVYLFIRLLKESIGNVEDTQLYVSEVINEFKYFLLIFAPRLVLGAELNSASNVGTFKWDHPPKTRGLAPNIAFLTLFAIICSSRNIY